MLTRRPPTAAHAPFNQLLWRSFASRVPNSQPQARVIGIRRENKGKWEQRVPLLPQHVKKLLKKGAVKEILVQPSSLRCASDDSYREVGARITEDLSPASVILGVKEVDINDLLPERTYMFFSHTVKAQPYNMELLDELLRLRINLIDYEMLVDQKTGDRSVKFGKFAGMAGMIDLLHMLGLRLLSQGYRSPLMNVPPAHGFQDLKAAQQAIRGLGKAIQTQGVPERFGPLILVFTGASGSVSKGAQEIFEELPHQYLRPSQMETLMEEGGWDNKTVYGVKVSSKDYVIDRKKKEPLKSTADYFENPQKYKSDFHRTIAPYASAIVNCLYWDERYPRLITKDQMKKIWQEDRRRLLGIADISADPGGSIEFMTKTTTIDLPFYVYDPVTQRESALCDIEAPGIPIVAIDNLPAQLPVDASKHFGDMLSPLIEDVAELDPAHGFSFKQVTAEGTKKSVLTATGTLSQDVTNKGRKGDVVELNGEIGNAIMTTKGNLTPRYKYITDLRKDRERSLASSRKKVLVLGSGRVVGPMLQYLVDERFTKTHGAGGLSYDITVAAADMQEAEALVKRVNPEKCKASFLDAARDANGLAHAVASHDIAVSLLPAPLHPLVAKACIKHGKPMVTASYVSPEMAALDKEAREKGITIVNEIGLDPGIDHLLSMQLIDGITEKGGSVTSYISWCGGLPAPEASDNPLGYKFSWSPRGVLTAGLNPAKYRWEGQLKEVEAGGALFGHAMSTNLYPGYALEGLPNRDALQYEPLYGLDKNPPRTMFRGTLRYAGFSNLLRCIQGMALLKDQNQAGSVPEWINTWSDLTGWCMLGAKSHEDVSETKLRDAIGKLLDNTLQGNASEIDRCMQAIEWIGLLDGLKGSSTHVVGSAHVPTSGPARLSPLDALSVLFESRMAYRPSERDAVLMTHEVVHSDPELAKQGLEQHHKCNLVMNGDPSGETAMATTVGLPAAMAVTLILEGKVKPKDHGDDGIVGVVRPLRDVWYEPILDRLWDSGIQWKDEVSVKPAPKK